MKSIKFIQKRFKILYISRYYNVGELSKKLGISRGTVCKWRDQLFPGQNDQSWRGKMFVKLYETKVFTIEEITGFLRMNRGQVLRFKRNYEKFNRANK